MGSSSARNLASGALMVMPFSAMSFRCSDVTSWLIFQPRVSASAAASVTTFCVAASSRRNDRSLAITTFIVKLPPTFTKYFV